MVISKPRKLFPQGKESVHGISPFLSTKNADFPQTIGTKVSSPKEKKSKPIVSRGKKKEKLSSRDIKIHVRRDKRKASWYKKESRARQGLL